MTDPLVPAELAFRADGTPFSPAFGDVYHSASGALAQSEYVFLYGNGLPERWRGHRVFTVMETGFGMGTNFLATWSAWHDDPARCERLHFVSIEKHPYTRDDLRVVLEAVLETTRLGPLAHALVDAWPTLVPGVHRIEFEGGRVTLTLAFGDALDMLPKLWLRADAFYLDGFAPSKNPDLWSPEVFRALARVAGEQATFATWSSAGDVKRALDQNGFEYHKVEGFSSKRTMLTGRFAPRWRVRRYDPPQPMALTERHAMVIGAGLAGCAIVERLAARGWRTTLIERNAEPAREASGNPAGVFHPLISRDDSSASRITRASFLYALRNWAALEAAGHVPSRGHDGLLHLATDDETRAVAAALPSFGYPSDYAVPVSHDDAQRIAGVAVSGGGWFYPQGGWIEPASLCRAQCAAAGERLDARFGVRVERLERRGDDWIALDENAREIARAPVVIFANASDATRVASLAFAPTRIVRGQLTLVAHSPLANLRVPVIGDGYAIPRAGAITLTGATYEVDDADPALRSPGHVENVERVARMLPALAATAEANPQQDYTGRVAFRCVTSDRLPMLGQLADENTAIRDKEQLRGAWPLDLPRAHGLYGAFAFGSRGLVWSALGAELIASQLEGEPWPLERELADHVDPARFLQRALRQRGV